ncbi:MAG: hypothetical protein WAW79_03505 [Steroidobacteraceae bacterium]
MRQPTALRFRQLQVPRLLAAVLAIGWLGLAVVPCQAMVDQLAAGSSHHDSIPGGDCGHCPAAQSGLDTSCATAAAPDCQPAGTALLERRDIESPQFAVAPPAAYPGLDSFMPDPGSVPDILAFRPPAPRVSIQQRYCIYLN